MHGLEQCNRERRAFRRSTPPGLVSPTLGSVLRGTPQAFSLLEPVVHGGISLADNGCFSRSQPFPGQRSPPATSQPASTLPAPVRPQAPRPLPVCPVGARFLTQSPLRPLTPTPKTAPSASTPLWDCYIPPDRSVLRICRLPARLPTRPISAHSPQPFLLLVWLRIIAPGPLRFGDLLFLKPLGTFLTMLPKPDSVNIYLVSGVRFPQKIRAFVSIWLQANVG